MGSGIAQCAAENGIETALFDVDDKALGRGLGSIRTFIGKKLEKGKISSAEHDAIVGRVKGSTALEQALAGVDMVVEAVFENISLKTDVFKKIDAICPPGVVLASNTSTLSISRIAAATANPQRVIGTHFFSPVPLMKLVEVIRGKDTSGETVGTALEFSRQIGKTAILAKDVPGFIVNRFLCLMYNEAADEIHRGLASAEDIDKGLKLGANHPMGPVEIMDMAGVDIVYFALQALYEMTGEERYRPSPIFEEMIKANRLGKKTGRGFYDYNK
jgi:3-hydroxybutyryl-CoA dehydrogenase